MHKTTKYGYFQRGQKHVPRPCRQVEKGKVYSAEVRHGPALKSADLSFTWFCNVMI